MGAEFDKERELDELHVMQTFARKPVEFVRGEGMRLYDDEGREYLDFLSGIGVVSIGHCEPSLVAAIQDQAAKLLHVSNYYYVEHRGAVAERVTSWLQGDSAEPWRIFFANSGAEANEGAIKTARRWGKEHAGGNYGIITANRSFHGRTYATLAATAQDAKQDPFAPLPEGFAHVPLNDIAALERAAVTPVDGTMPVAVMLEPVQGESGVWPCTQEYLEAARRICDEHNMLLIFDEVQTGFFRCGAPFSYQLAGIEPDVVTMAKGIGGGFPMGAFAARGEAADLLGPGDHGSTFGGNALAAAVGRSCVEALVEEGIGEHAIACGEHLAARLACLPHVSEVRGHGLMRGAQLDAPVATEVVEKGLERGLVLNHIGDSILRFLPPLCITDEQVDEGMDRLEALLAKH